MKLTAIILLVACLSVSARGFSQITLAEKNAPLEKIFKELQKQSGYDFLFSYTLVKNAGSVTVSLKNVSIQQAVEEVLKGKDLGYEILGKTVVIKPKSGSPNEPTITEPVVIAQIDISGKVTDNDGNPLEGATVSVKGTKNITKTDAIGMFILKGVNEDAVLEISYAEHETATLKIGGRTSIVVSLKRAEITMGEVTINKGYYSEKQKVSIGNAVHIGKDVIEKQPVQNVLLALQGRVPGLEITQVTGINGGAVNVRIQGINSVGSLPNSLVKTSTDPLIIVDGVPFPTQLIGSFWMEDLVAGGSPLNYINPNEIESIDVLKDADATSIYGSRAANGAILITTKKGKAGRTKFNVNVQQGWSKVAHPADLLDTRQYLDMRYEAYKNGGVNIATLPPNATNYDIKLWDTTRYTDWQKELIGGTSRYTNINAGISGGTSAVQYVIGATYNRRSTVFPGDFDDQAGGLHFNVSSSSVNQRFKVQLTGTYSYDQNHLPTKDLTQVAILMAPDAPALYNADGTLNWAPNAAGSSSWVNPLAYTENSEFNNTTKTLFSNISASYTILPGLEIRGNFGYTNLLSSLFNPTRLEFYRPEQRTSQVRGASFGNREMSTWITEPQLGYIRKIGKGIIDALIGTTIQQSTQTYLSLNGRGQPNDLLLKSLTAATTITVNNSQSSTFKFNGLFGRLNYNLNGKYLVNLTARRDGSNKFGEGNKFHNFGSVGVGWIFSQEKLFQNNLSFLSFGKLRASYGTTGNDQIPDFSYLSIYYVNNPGILYQNGIGLQVSGHSNPFLQWEETRKWQGGLDLGFFSNRINISATYARNQSSNQLTSYDLPDLTGFPSISKNLPATVQNTSWEFILNTVNLKEKNFSWSSSFNLTIPRNELVSFPGIEQTPYASGDRGLIIGQPLGAIKVYKYAGVDQATGNYMVYDKNGVPVRFPNSITDKTVLVSTLPSSYGGLVNSFSYKGFHLDFLFQFIVQKGKDDLYYSNGINPNAGPGFFATGTTVIANQPITVLNQWQKPGDQAPIGKYVTSPNNPIWPEQSDVGYTNASGSFIRLKNLSLSWELPKDWIQKAHLQNAQIYFSGQNLATFTKYKGLDPETRGNSRIPPLQTLTAGVRFDL